jgi:uncharacterized protein
VQQDNLPPENILPGSEPPKSEPPAPIQFATIPPVSEPPHPSPRVWEGWPTAAFGVAIFAIYSIVQTIVAFVFLAIATIEAKIANPGLNITQYIMGQSSNGLMLSITIVVSAIAGIGFIILFIKLRQGYSIKEYLELKSISLKRVLVLIGVVAALILISSFLEPFIAKNQNSQFAVNAYQTAVWPALIWIATVVFAPAFEETFFRGFLFVGLRQSQLGAAGTIFLTAATWAALHALQYNLFGVAQIFVLGLVFGIVRLKTGTLWSTLILHAVWNLAAMVGTVLYINGIGT